MYLLVISELRCDERVLIPVANSKRDEYGMTRNDSIKSILRNLHLQSYIFDIFSWHFPICAA